MLSSETCDEIKQIKGNARGAVFQTDAKYIKMLYGQEKLDQLANTLNKLGHPIAYDKIQPMEWYPLYQRVLSFKVMEELFNWQNADFLEMGHAAPKYSFIVKLLMKFLISAKTGLKNAPQYWTRHYDIGTLKVVDFSEEQKFSIIQLHDFKIDPIYCSYLKGYFKRLFAFTLPKHIIKIEESKCMHQGDPYHEYNVSWVPKAD